MRKILVMLMVVLMTFTVVAPIIADSPTATLFIGRDAAINAGTVDVTVNNDGNILVTYNVNPVENGGWVLSEAHIYADTISPTKSAPGKFPYSATQTSDPNVWTCTIPLDLNSGENIYIAAHAALIKTVETPNPIKGGSPLIETIQETAWAKADTENFPIPPGKNWATYFILAQGGGPQ
jgi:hypothetical protein